MEKSLLKVLFAFTLSLLTFSCNEQVRTENSNDDQILSYLQKAGQDHNKGLEYIFNQLSSTESSPQNFNQLITLVQSHTNDFLEQKTESFIRSNSRNAKKYSNQAIENIRLRKAKNARINESETIWNDSDSDKLTAKQKELLSIINQAIVDENLGLKETLEALEGVRSRVKIECSDEEAFAILAAIEIGTNSLTYWYENIDKWSDLISSFEENSSSGSGSNKNAKEDTFNWKSVGKADISGAVGAAVGVGVAAAVTGPPGWAAGGAAVAGGAVGASAGDAVLQLLNSWF